MYVYIKSESNLYTVGFYAPAGTKRGCEWIAESDHDTSEGAATRVHYLNGGSGWLADGDSEVRVRVG